MKKSFTPLPPMPIIGFLKLLSIKVFLVLTHTYKKINSFNVSNFFKQENLSKPKLSFILLITFEFWFTLKFYMEPNDSY